MSSNTTASPRSDHESFVTNATDHEGTAHPVPPDAVNEVIDEWGEDSFPASDPPGCLPPSLVSSTSDESEHLATKA